MSGGDEVHTKFGRQICRVLAGFARDERIETSSGSLANIACRTTRDNADRLHRVVTAGQNQRRRSDQATQRGGERGCCCWSGERAATADHDALMLAERGALRDAEEIGEARIVAERRVRVER